MSQPETVLDHLTKHNAETAPAIDIYTDGACSGNPGVGGWGALMICGALETELYGGDPQTTNNRMEMMGAIEALSVLPYRCQVNLYTDSQYLKDGITLWIINWKKNDWKTASKKPVKNQDLWLRLDDLISKHAVAWHWVRGHDGHEQNERADALARNGIVAQRMAATL